MVPPTVITVIVGGFKRPQTVQWQALLPSPRGLNPNQKSVSLHSTSVYWEQKT